MPQDRHSALIKNVMVKMSASFLLIQFIALYSSEFFNCIYNNRFDSLSLDFVARLPYVFKPTVFIVFMVAYFIQLAVLFITLRPMINFLRLGEQYDQARIAAIKLPWRIVILQTFTWILGTTAYYMLKGWHTESGIPYGYSMIVKLASGFAGALFSCIIANIHLLPIKRIMRIVDIRPGETDHFTRNKNLFIGFSTTFIIVANFIYFSYYLQNPHTLLVHPSLVIAIWGVFYIAVALGLSAFSKFEYDTQFNFLKERISRLLNSEMSSADDRVQLLYFDDVGEFAALFNKFLDKFRGLLDKITSSAFTLSDSVQELSTTTKEVISTSNMQAAAVKEVVSTMEDSNTITQSIGKSITEVTRIAMKTKEHVDSGTDIVQDTTDKMTEIRKKNTDTISGIRSLTDKIRAIWDIVDIINTIVEQTRIIAFNAALEASTAGEAGKNFRIVAGEIKRLADSTSQSTTEIQARITEIQKAANNLIVVSEEGTERIRQGYELSDKLHSVFSDILNSADISVTSSESIEYSIRQQASAFEQILITMKEISKGIDNLVVTQQQTAHTAETLNGMAGSLKSQAGQFIVTKKTE